MGGRGLGLGSGGAFHAGLVVGSQRDGREKRELRVHKIRLRSVRIGSGAFENAEIDEGWARD